MRKRTDLLSKGILQLVVSLIFLARGWLTWRWDSPIRELIWEEAWWAPVLSHFDLTWSHFARTSDAWISPTLDAMGIFLVISALLPWLSGISRLRWMRWLLLPGIVILILDAFSRWVARDMQAGIGMEYALQIISPIALLIFLGAQTTSGRRGNLIKGILLIAAASTFTGHGLYAVDYYSVPLEFRMMTTEILPLSETASLLFLKIVGWLDFVVVVLLFMPITRRVALAYMACWGGLTSLARIVAYFDAELPRYGLDPALIEALVRTPHWLIPLWLLLRESSLSKRREDRDHPPIEKTGEAQHTEVGDRRQDSPIS
ncbi:MAG: hypothetical protein ACJAVK_002632 [Akkermansiaceae bacterium]|jgi:hypothetical protein